MRTAICTVIIQDKKILLVRKNQSWILPGGKPEENESDLECLCREVNEELSGTQLQNISYYREFEGVTPHKCDILKAKVYFSEIKGELYSIREGDSISQAEWANDFKKYNLSDITSKVIDSLKRENYL